MSALLTDPVTGDLVFTNNELTFVDGPQQVRQSLASRLRSFKGEWFLDLTFGTPLLQQILVKNPVNAEAALKNEILGTNGVLGLLSFSLDINKATRVGVVDFSVQSQQGPLAGAVEFSLTQTGG